MEKDKTDRNKAARGFASMDPEKQKEIASTGGKTAHERGVAHEWNSEEARKAGKKGGQSAKRGDYFRGDDMPIL